MSSPPLKPTKFGTPEKIACACCSVPMNLSDVIEALGGDVSCLKGANITCDGCGRDSRVVLVETIVKLGLAPAPPGPAE